MNILQVTPRLSAPPNDGGAVYVYFNTKYLSLLGQNVSIASFISNKHEQDITELEKFASVFAVDGKFKPYHPFAILRSTITRQPVSIQHRMDQDLMSEALQKVKQHQRPDIILLEGLHTVAFFDLLKNQFPQVPIVLRQANVEHLLLKRIASATKNIFLKAFYFDQYRLMKKFELAAMKKVDAVTAITEYDKNIYLKYLPNLKCFVSPAGTEIPEPLDIDGKNNKLLAISSWGWKPNIDGLEWFLSNVWPKLIKRYPNIEFDVAGSGLSEKFKNKYAHKNIRYLGFVDDLEPLRQSASIFIAPLFSGSGMKLKIIEGMASGLPIITTRFGAEGIDIEDEVHYKEANSEKEFEAALIRLLENHEFRNALSVNAREVAKNKYSWEEITKHLITFLEKIVS